MTHKLFESFQLKSLTLSNRCVMAPMTRCRALDDDQPNALMAEYYAQRASAGLIITEGVPVSDRGRGYLWTPGISTPAQIAGWKQVAEAVHAKGGKLFLQAWHVGRVSHTSLHTDGASPEGPTNQQAPEAVCFAYDDDGQPGYVPVSQPNAMEPADFARVTADFVKAAEQSIQIGIDGIELHAENGYLFDQFLNAVVNSRNDAYGGSPENRCRFLLDTLDQMTRAIGSARIGVRISPNGRFNAMPEDPHMHETFAYLADQLSQRDIAYLHINDQTTFGLPAIPDDLLTMLRERFDGNLMLCGGFDADRARQAIDSGLADLVAFGVPFIANPDLPARMQQGWPLNEPQRDTFYGGGAEGYTDYPFHGVD